VGFVVEEERVRRAAHQVDDVGERGSVATHRVHAVDDHALRPLVGQLLEDRCELLDVVVPKALEVRAREPDGRHERVVGLLVDDRVVVATEVPRDAAEVGHVPGGEHERGFTAVEVGEFCLEVAMQGKRAVEQA
jgi:hypothetical protein